MPDNIFRAPIPLSVEINVPQENYFFLMNLYTLQNNLE